MPGPSNSRTEKHRGIRMRIHATDPSRTSHCGIQLHKKSVPCTGLSWGQHRHWGQFMKVACISAAAVIVLLAGGATADDFEFLNNDDLEFRVGETEVLTTGDSTPDEWLVARLVNEKDDTFVATEIQFMVAAAGNTQNGGLLCELLGRSTAIAESLRFETKIWADNIDEDDNILPDPGGQLFAFMSEDNDSNARVNHITRVELGSELHVEPGEGVRVGIRFLDGANICSGQLVQDQTSRLGEPRNFSRTSLAALDCSGLEDILPDFCSGCTTCSDATLRWRRWNGCCSTSPDGVMTNGATGDLAIRLAAEIGGGSTGGDTGGPRDVGGNTDTGTPDAGVDATPDAGTTEELTINRVSPSMGPVNLDVDLQIFGTGFVDGLDIRIGPQGLQAITVIDSGELTATLPGGTLSMGTYDVIASLGADEYEHRSGYQVTDAEYEAPSIRSIEPNSATQGVQTEVTIRGGSFHEDADVFFGGRSGMNIQVNDEGDVLTVTAPGTLPAGVYDVEIENPDQQSDIIRGGWQVLALADTPSEEGCCAVAGGSTRGADALLFVFGALALIAVRRRRRA